MTDKYEIAPLVNCHCGCGENPLWDEERQLLYWCDIEPGRVFSYDPANGRHEMIHKSDQAVGGFTLQTDGRLLLFRKNGFAALNPDGSLEALVEGIDDDGMARFNDVMADTEGRVLAGTIGVDSQQGGLYRVDHNGVVTCLFRGTGCSNGMGFAPDLQKMYWICSTTRRLFRFRYDASKGDLSDREMLKEFPREAGTPDGMTVDSEGCLWIAHYGGYSVCRYTPDGELIHKIDVPVRAPTSVIFGGSDMKDLYITSAGGSDDADTEDGTLYIIHTDIKGKGEYHSSISVDRNGEK